MVAEATVPRLLSLLRRDVLAMPQGDGLKILVADELAKEGLEMLKSSGIAFDVKVGMKEDELTATVPSYDALIVRSGAKVTAKVMANPGKLKVIARAGV